MRNRLNEEWQRAMKEVARLESNKPELMTTLGLGETLEKSLARRAERAKKARERRDEVGKAYRDHCRTHGCST